MTQAYTVVAVYEDTYERYFEVVQAASVKEAIEKVQKPSGNALLIAAVFEGQLAEPVDEGLSALDDF